MIRAEINELKTKITENISATKSWYFEKINSIGKPLAKFIKKKGGDTHIKIRKEMGDITFSADIKGIIRKQ